MVDRPRFGLLRAAVATLALVSLPTACADEPEAGAALGPAAYRVVIDRFVPDPRPPDEPLRIVYVAMIGGAELSLDEQVAIIEGFEITHEVRFVDDIAAAIDGEQPGAPPKDDGTVLALGPIAPSPPHTVRVEEYVDAERTDASIVTLAPRRGDWVVEAVDPVDPEVVPAEVVADE